METTSTRKQVKKTYQKYVRLELTRHDALRLMDVLKADTMLSDSTRKRIKQEFASQLEPQYEATVKCTDCNNTFTMVFRRPEDVVTQAMCAICSDDYK